MIITPKVEIIRDGKGELLDETAVVAVLTCAAPVATAGREGMSEGEYEEMFYQRIVKLLTCTAYYRYRHIVLGAWGCGAFGNDARVISNFFSRRSRRADSMERF